MLGVVISLYLQIEGSVPKQLKLLNFQAEKSKKTEMY